MSKSAGPEQLLAIEHHGGVALSAGAGSGKTFVLVNHILFLIKEFQKTNQHLPDLEYCHLLRQHLTQFAVMTFTRKAAGELTARLYQQVASDKAFRAPEALSSLSIGTIHSFCFLLIKQFRFPGKLPDAGIISDAAWRHKLTALFDQWINERLSSLPGPLAQLVAQNEDEMLKSLYGIFGDASLRTAWKNHCIPYGPGEIWATFFPNYFDVTGLSQLWTAPPSLSKYTEQQTKSWFTFLQQFIPSLPSRSAFLDDRDLRYWIDFFATAKIPNAPQARSGLTEIISYFSLIREFKSFCQNSGEELLSFLDNYQTHCRPWALLFHEIFQYLDSNYDAIPGITYADLEYITRQGLSNPHTASRAREHYKYFVIDEFQDTSDFQFSIIQTLIDNDYKKLFIVGDIKQAIYRFRGGNVNVFKKCLEHMPEKLVLQNNYRSSAELITFNNGFFSRLLPLGEGYCGSDQHSVSPGEQKYPDEVAPLQPKCVTRFVLNLTQNDNVGQTDLNRIEAHAICQIIQHLSSADTDDSSRICVLYKKLSPSLHLIQELLGSGQSFSAQIKISPREEPICHLFLQLITACLSPTRQDQFLLFHIRGVLHYLQQVKSDDEILLQINIFFHSLPLLGPSISFANLVFNLGLSISEHSLNLDLINAISTAAGESISEIYKCLAQMDDSSFSLNLQSGANSRITIMTIHSAKGLEF